MERFDSTQQNYTCESALLSVLSISANVDVT